MCGGSYPTQLLADTLRGRKLVSLEWAVHALTGKPAQLLGLRDRGTVAVGAHADLVVFDPETVGSAPATLVRDLPGDAPRMVAASIGVKRVYVNGVETVVDGEAHRRPPGNRAPIRPRHRHRHRPLTTRARRERSLRLKEAGEKRAGAGIMRAVVDGVEVLRGGVANAGEVVRVGDDVLRPAPSNSATIHRLLRHLRRSGVAIAPEPRSLDDGRERLRFIPGDVPIPPYPDLGAVGRRAGVDREADPRVA